MKKFLKVAGLILLVIIVFILVAGLLMSKTYSIQRDVTINASRERVWTHVNSLQQMEQWNPWRDKDPNIHVGFEGKEGAVGSMYHWEGNKDVGSGNQAVTRVDPMQRMDSHIHFIKPFEGQADASVTLADTGTATKVSWSFTTTYPYPMNAMRLFMNMDKIMGTAYDQGLARLKQLCESNP